jgi:hypothetical protein
MEEQDANEALERTIKNEIPKTPEWAGMYMKAFWDLKDSRQYGDMGGACEMSFLALDAWARRHQIPDEEFWTFQMFMRALDNEYLEYVREESKKANKETSQDGGNSTIES